MSDVVLVATIGATSTLLVAVISPWLASKIANRQADRLESREAAQWKRSEERRHAEIKREDGLSEKRLQREDALQQDEIERESSRKKDELLAARLRECWTHALASRVKMLKLLRKASATSEEISPSIAAANAYAVALLGLTDIYPLAKMFYQATENLELAILEDEMAKENMIRKDWETAFKKLEMEIAKLSGVVPRM